MTQIARVTPDGHIHWTSRNGQPQQCRAALGKGGLLVDKREGDGATPIGLWPVRRILYRPDRLPAPITSLPIQPITPDVGWCDAPEHPEYNRPVPLPFAASHEKLWREDGVYDVIGILGHNDAPPIPGHGSAIFLHVARPTYLPTEGCVALALADLLRLLADLGPEAALRIG